MTQRFDRRAVRDALKAVGVLPGRTVYVTGNLGRVGMLADGLAPGADRKIGTLNLFLETLEELLGGRGTIVFPTHTWRLVGSDEVFDPSTTPTAFLFSEHIRTCRPCNRQIHPFASVAATGAFAGQFVTDNLCRHPYGPGTPFQALADADALHLSIGLHARQTISAVHHCEFVAGVPYRYTKSFTQRCRLESDRVIDEEFFLFVTYGQVPIERDRNEKIVALERNAAALLNAPLGRAFVESIPLGTFVHETIKAMRRAPYIWLRSLPEKKPWLV